MALINERFIEDLIASTPIVEVMSSELPKKEGSTYVCKSPFNDERTPSCRIFPQTNTFKDFSSGNGGNSISYLMKKKNYSYREAIIALAEIAHRQVEYDNDGDVEEYNKRMDEQEEARNVLRAVHLQFQKKLHQLPKEHEAWQEIFRRGYTEEKAKTLELGFAPGHEFIYEKLSATGNVQIGRDLGVISKEKPTDRDWNRLVYPFFNQKSELVGYASRALREEDVKKVKWMNPSDNILYKKSRFWYGIDKAFQKLHQTKCAWIVEGYNDVIAWQDNGIENTVAPCGTNIHQDQIKELKKYADRVVLCQDGDKAGRKSIIKNTEAFLRNGFNVEVCLLPDNLDPDDFIRKVYLKETFENEENSGLEHQIRKINHAVKNGFKFLCDEYLKGSNAIENSDPAKKLAAIIFDIQDSGLAEIYRDMLAKESKIKATIIKQWLKDLEKQALEKEKQKYSEYVWPPSPELKAESIEKHKDQIEKYGFFQAKNQIWMMVGDDKPYHFKSVSNFSIEIIQHMHDEKFPKKLLQIKNTRNQERIFDVRADILVALTDFKKMLSLQGNYKWRGNVEQLENLTDYLYDSMGTGRAIDVLGWNPEGFFCWNNAVSIPGEGKIDLDENGIFKHKDVTYYVPSANSIYKQNPTKYQAQKKLILKKPPFSMSEYLHQIRLVHGDNAISGILFLFASAFQDIVERKLNSFPVLFMYGLPSTGKDQLVLALTSFFGLPQAKISLESRKTTAKAQVREFAQFGNIIVGLSEFENTPENNFLIKGLWDRMGYKYGTIESAVSSEAVPILSAPIITGNSYPTNDAAISRCLWLEFTKTEFTDIEKTNYDKMQDMTQKIVSDFMNDIIQHRAEFEEQFQNLHRKWMKVLATRSKMQGLVARVFNNMAVMTATFEIFSKHYALGFSEYEMLNHFDQMGEILKIKLENSNAVSKFWLSFIASLKDDKGLRYGEDYKIEGNQLLFNFTSIYIKISQFWFRLHNENMPAKSELIAKLRSDEAYITSKAKGVRFDKSKEELDKEAGNLKETNSKKSTSAEIFDLNKVTMSTELSATIHTQMMKTPEPPIQYSNESDNSAQGQIQYQGETKEDDALPF